MSLTPAPFSFSFSRMRPSIFLHRGVHLLLAFYVGLELGRGWQ